MVMLGELGQDLPQVALPERDDLGQALGLDRANEAFREGVQVRTAGRELHRFYPRGLQDCLEARREQRIAIVDQVARAAEESGLCIGDVTGDLLLSQDAVLGLEVVDDLLLAAVHPAGHDREEELKVWRGHGSEGREGRR